jgi:hypothetical protein
MKAMARDPVHRHDTARELAADLEKFNLRRSFLFGRSSLKQPHWSRVSRSRVRVQRTTENTSFLLGSQDRSVSSVTVPFAGQDTAPSDCSNP